MIFENEFGFGFKRKFFTFPLGFTFSLDAMAWLIFRKCSLIKCALLVTH